MNCVGLLFSPNHTRYDYLSEENRKSEFKNVFKKLYSRRKHWKEVENKAFSVSFRLNDRIIPPYFSSSCVLVCSKSSLINTVTLRMNTLFGYWVSFLLATA